MVHLAPSLLSRSEGVAQHNLVQQRRRLSSSQLLHFQTRLPVNNCRSALVWRLVTNRVRIQGCKATRSPVVTTLGPSCNFQVSVSQTSHQSASSSTTRLQHHTFAFTAIAYRGIRYHIRWCLPTHIRHSLPLVLLLNARLRAAVASHVQVREV